jgi:hypothetical protein
MLVLYITYSGEHDSSNERFSTSSKYHELSQMTHQINQTEAFFTSSHEHHELGTQLLKLLIKTSASAKEVSA